MTQEMQRHGLGDAGHGLVEQAAELTRRQGPARTAPRGTVSAVASGREAGSNCSWLKSGSVAALAAVIMRVAIWLPSSLHHPAISQFERDRLS